MFTISASANGLKVQQNEKLTTNTMADKYDDTELVRLLRGEKSAQDQALVFIMSGMRIKIINYLTNRGCSKDKAEGYFLEGLTKGVQSIVNDKYRGEGSLEGFFKKISNNVWLTALRSEKASKTREEKVGNSFTTADLSADDLVFHEQRAFLLKEVLQKLGPGCSEIMLLKAEGYKSKEIIKLTDYTSAGSIDKRYSVCMEKLRTLMKENPHIMNLLKELHEK